jgi:transposase
MRNLVDLLWKEWKIVEDQIKGLSLELERISAADPGCTRIRQIPGIGPFVATPIVAAIGKRGNVYLRKILIHGVRAAVLRIKRDRAPIGAWLDALDARAPKNVAVVAMANKLARIAWAVLSSGEDYRPNSNMVAA